MAVVIGQSGSGARLMGGRRGGRPPYSKREAILERRRPRASSALGEDSLTRLSFET